MYGRSMHLASTDPDTGGIFLHLREGRSSSEQENSIGQRDALAVCGQAGALARQIRSSPSSKRVADERRCC